MSEKLPEGYPEREFQGAEQEARQEATLLAEVLIEKHGGGIGNTVAVYTGIARAVMAVVPLLRESESASERRLAERMSAFEDPRL